MSRGAERRQRKVSLPFPRRRRTNHDGRLRDERVAARACDQNPPLECCGRNVRATSALPEMLLLREASTMLLAKGARAAAFMLSSVPKCVTGQRLQGPRAEFQFHSGCQPHAMHDNRVFVQPHLGSEVQPGPAWPFRSFVLWLTSH